MNICFFIDDFSAVGGIQRITPIVCNALSEYHTVHVVSIYNEHGSENKELYVPKIKLNTLIEGKKEYIKQSLRAAGLLRKYLRRNEIDILVSSSEMLVPYCYLAVVGLKIPFACWTHTPALSYDETILQKPFKWIASKKAAYIIALTKDNRDTWKTKYNIDNVVEIPNPIDPGINRNHCYDIDSRKIVSVGRICYQKNYETLIEVAKIAFAKATGWEWDIYGDGKDRQNIERLITENGLESSVILKGNVSNMYELYKNYAMQVMTSRFEGFPMTLLEGMANGLPLLGFDVPGVGEVIKNGENGYLVDPFNASDMAEKILGLINSDELRRKFSDNSFSSCDNYGIGAAIEKWNSLFEKMKK